MTYGTKERKAISLVKDQNAYCPASLIIHQKDEPVWDRTANIIKYKGVNYTVAEYVKMRQTMLRTGKNLSADPLISNSGTITYRGVTYTAAEYINMKRSLHRTSQKQLRRKSVPKKDGFDKYFFAFKCILFIIFLLLFLAEYNY